MIRPIRAGITLALASSFSAAVLVPFMPWIMRVSMIQVSVLCIILAATLALSTRTHPIRIQRRLTRLSGRLLRTTSVIVGLIAISAAMKLFGDPILPGFGTWLTVLAILHVTIAWWDRRAWRHPARRWRARKISSVVHLVLSLALAALHAALLLQ